jgi:hypothetical protein
MHQMGQDAPACGLERDEHARAETAISRRY